MSGEQKQETRRVRCLVMSRVVGYYSATQDWHQAKRLEFKQRKTYKVPQ